MKKLLVFAIASVFLLQLSAQSMYIIMKDGTWQKIRTKNIHQVEFIDRTASDSLEDIEDSINARKEEFTKIFSMMGCPSATYGTTTRHDDFGYISAAFSQDIEGADVVVQNSGYNWFSVCAEYVSRMPNYANPYMRYIHPYNHIRACNVVIGNREVGSNEWAQAKAMRAFAYMSLAPYFSFSYMKDKSALSVPILEDGIIESNNPRVTLKVLYDYILADLNAAIEVLENESEPRTDKSQIDVNVAYGLRARANLAMGNWANAAADAEKAMKGYTPASISEVSVPSFYNINDHNWMWGIDLTEEQTEVLPFATSASWIGSFSSNAYAATCQCYACCNVNLWNMIPSTDVRKGWWVDETLCSPLLETLTWTDSNGNVASGQDIGPFQNDNKMPFLPYTNVKFGMTHGIGSSNNTNDWPLMRVEEMYLIVAEALAQMGAEMSATSILENFVKKYRDTNYDVTARNLSLLDEIWFQRRVELWGEGFYSADAKRMEKPIVRFHEGEDTNWPEAYKINVAADNGWLNMRFPSTVMNNNTAIVDNTDGEQPVAGQNGNLLDGVTNPKEKSYLYIPGNAVGWNHEKAPALVEVKSGVFKGIAYMDGEFKLTPNRDWSSEYNAGYFTTVSEDFDVSEGSFANINFIGTPGVYILQVDLNKKSLEATRINSMNIVGEFCGWDPSSVQCQMTWNKEKTCYEITNVALNTSQFGWKFVVNGDWALIIGGPDINNLQWGGDNIQGDGNTVRLYPCRTDSNNMYCVVTTESTTR